MCGEGSRSEQRRSAQHEPSERPERNSAGQRSLAKLSKLTNSTHSSIPRK